MTIQELEYALWLHGVMSKDAKYIVDISMKNGIKDRLIDDELEQLGYDKIFDFEDNFVEDGDYIEKFPHKNRFIED